MNTALESDVTLELNNIEELFEAPDINPFSTREIDILGEAGIDRIRKQAMHVWPRKPAAGRLVLLLPPDQLALQTAEQVRDAIHRHCEAQLEQNWLKRRQAIRTGWRQLAIALALIALDIVILFWLFNGAAFLLPPFLRGVLAMVAVLAGSLALWDGIQSLAFSWEPYLQTDEGYRSILKMDVLISQLP